MINRIRIQELYGSVFGFFYISASNVLTTLDLYFWRDFYFIGVIEGSNADEIST